MSSQESKLGGEEVYFERQVSVESLQASEQFLAIDQKLECDVGCVVWDAALLLAKYLDFNCQQLTLQSANVVELGAGTGFCGLMAAALGAQVLITDLSYCVDIMRRNVSKNKHLVGNRIRVEEFDWNQTDPKSDAFFGLKLSEINLILVSDCVYYEQSVEQLFRTIDWLASKGATVLLSYEERDDKRELIDKFFKLVDNRFEIIEIESQELHPEYRSPDLHLLRIRRVL